MRKIKLTLGSHSSPSLVFLKTRWPLQNSPNGSLGYLLAALVGRKGSWSEPQILGWPAETLSSPTNLHPMCTDPERQGTARCLQHRHKC